MHEEGPLARDYTKLDPNVPVIAPNPTDGHRFLSQQHANVVSWTTACIYDLLETVDIDSWRQTAPFPYWSMQTAIDSSFDEHKTPWQRTELPVVRQDRSGLLKFLISCRCLAKNVTRNWIGGSETTCRRTTCPAKLHV